MPGPTPPWDQSEEPRENTVDLPRIDLAKLADYFAGSAPPPELHRPDDTDGRPAGDRPGPVSVAADGVSAARPDVAHEDVAREDVAREDVVGVDVAAADAADADARAPSASARTAPAGPMVPAAPVVSAAPVVPAVPAAERAAIAAGTQNRASEYTAAERARPGSLAQLRARLARLPDGHPSALYEDGGQARPLPVRLRQLELGLPAPVREPSESISVTADLAGELPAPTAAGHSADETRPAAADDARPAAADDARPAAAHEARPAAADDALELADGRELSADRDAEPVPAHAQVRAPQWQDPYAARSGGNGHASHADPASISDSAASHHDLQLAPWPGTGPSGTGDAANGDGHDAGNGGGPLDLPRHATPRSDRTRRANGSAGTSELRDLVDRSLARCRKAEGQNVFGAYGTSGLTPAIQRIAAQLPAGGLAPGSEADTLKPADRFAAKLSRLITRNPGGSPEELAAEISDGVRYAFAFEPGDYTEATWLVHRKLKAQGFELEARRNRWQNPEFKGIFTRWRDPAHDLPFEVQFHTTASWRVQKRTHDAYLRITDPATPPAERADLRARQVAAAAAATIPPGCLEIADFRSEPR